MKICKKCKKEKENNYFGKNKKVSDGLQAWCKKCHKQYNKDNNSYLREKKKEYYLKNKNIIDKNNREYYLKNKKRRNIENKIYRKNNKDKVVKKAKEYYRNNKDIISKKSRRYRIENHNSLQANSKIYYLSGAKYETYYKRLTIDESPRLSKDNISLEVKCRYCGEYYIPTNVEVKHRIQSLNNNTLGDSFIYCSENCKISCSTYGQIKYQRGFKKASSREVNPLVRQMCFERDSWACQICGATQKKASLHCHHIEGQAQNPRLGNDIVNVITLCETCHKEVHKLPGCNYYELQCKK